MNGEGAIDTPPAGTAIFDDIVGWLARRPGAVRLIALTGPAGAGKSHLAHATLALCAEARMLTGSGKFGEGRVDAAFEPIMAGLSALVSAGLRTLFDRQTGVASLADALGVHLDVLIAAGLSVPDFDTGESPPALANRRGSAARITAAVLALLAWLERFEVPRVLLIDDWYRASDDARQLVETIAATPVHQPLALLLTQRDPEVSLRGPIARQFRVAPLDTAATRALLAERLGDEAALIAADCLADAAVPPLPFDVLQAAEALIESGALHPSGGRWVLDAARYRGLAFDARARVAGLDRAAFRAALALALWGDKAPGAEFRRALAAGDAAGGEAADDAIAVLRRREIVAETGGRLAFRHDRLRAQTLARADARERVATARRLCEAIVPAGASAETEIAALHLRLTAGVDDADPERWRDRFARGATAARNRGDARAADDFAEAALALEVRAPTGSREGRRLILREALIAAANRDDPVTEPRARALIATARTSTERLADHEVAIVALRLAGMADAGWAIACEGLESVGVRPPPARPNLRALLSAARWRYLPRGNGRFEPGAEADAFTGMAAAAAHLAYHRDPMGTAIIGFEASRLSGHAFLHSAYWRSVDAFLFAAIGQRAAAADAAERAIEGLPGQRVFRAATLYQALFFGMHWRQTIASQRPAFLEVVRMAEFEGDLVTAAYGWRIHVMSGWRCGVDLPTLARDAAAARRALDALGEQSFVAEMDAMVRLLAGLTGTADWAPAAWCFDLPSRNHVIDLELSNLAGDWEETVRRAERLRPLWGDYRIQADSVALGFHETLARLRTGRRPRRGMMRFLRAAAELNPHDHVAKLRLLEAEALRLTRVAPARLRAAYAAAIAAADASDSRLDAGLAAHCAAEAMEAAGEVAGSEIWRGKAEAIWRAWGLRPDLRPLSAAAPAGERVAEAAARAAAAERADQAKTRLLAHVGHELRTPLQALQAALDLATQHGEDVDAQEVRRALGGLTRVVEDLDVIGGLADARAVPDRNVDLAALVRSEAASWPAAGIVVDAEGAEVTVDVAADRVRQIVRNLLSNAVKYGRAPIEVRVALVPDGETIRATLTVADHGPGVPAAAREAIFEPFARGPRSGDGQGVGLGLPLSRQLAERLGGTLELVETGGGAVFRLRLLLPRSAAPCPAPLAAPTRALDILLVDDAAPVRQLIAAILSGAGHRVRQAVDGAGAIRAWEASVPELAIFDLGLPDADGLELLSRLRRNRPDVPAILLTAAAQVTAPRDPSLRVLRKPTTAETLQATIAALIGPDTAPLSAAGAVDADPLWSLARFEVIAQARSALAGGAAASPQALHRLAGTAAQFGWAGVAEAVEDLARARAQGAALPPAEHALRASLEAMA